MAHTKDDQLQVVVPGHGFQIPSLYTAEPLRATYLVACYDKFRASVFAVPLENMAVTAKALNTMMSDMETSTRLSDSELRAELEQTPRNFDFSSTCHVSNQQDTYQLVRHICLAVQHIRDDTVRTNYVYAMMSLLDNGTDGGTVTVSPSITTQQLVPPTPPPIVVACPKSVVSCVNGQDHCWLVDLHVTMVEEFRHAGNSTPLHISVFNDLVVKRNKGRPAGELYGPLFDAEKQREVLQEAQVFWCRVVALFESSKDNMPPSSLLMYLFEALRDTTCVPK